MLTVDKFKKRVFEIHDADESTRRERVEKLCSEVIELVSALPQMEGYAPTIDRRIRYVKWPQMYFGIYFARPFDDGRYVSEVAVYVKNSFVFASATILNTPEDNPYAQEESLVNTPHEALSLRDVFATTAVAAREQMMAFAERYGIPA